MAHPGGKLAYVSCIGTNEVAELDLTQWKVTRVFHTGKGTDGLALAATN